MTVKIIYELCTHTPNKPYSSKFLRNYALRKACLWSKKKKKTVLIFSKCPFLFSVAVSSWGFRSPRDIFKLFSYAIFIQYRDSCSIVWLITMSPQDLHVKYWLPNNHNKPFTRKNETSREKRLLRKQLIISVKALSHLKGLSVNRKLN